MREFLRTESGNPKLDTDRVVARSEAEEGHRNAALAHFIASYGNLQNPVDRVLDHSYAHCAIEASCRDLALAGLFLSKHGLRVNERRLLGRTDAKRMNAVMLTCGTYDAAGEFAYRVGLPAKSGVGGGVLAVIPRHGTLCAWGPRLDAAGSGDGKIPRKTSKVSALLRAPGVVDPGRVDDAGTERPDPEVPESAKRRTFTAKYRLAILAEYDSAPEGTKGAFCAARACAPAISWSGARREMRARWPGGRCRAAASAATAFSSSVSTGCARLPAPHRHPEVQRRCCGSPSRAPRRASTGGTGTPQHAAAAA